MVVATLARSRARGNWKKVKLLVLGHTVNLNLLRVCRLAFDSVKYLTVAKY